MRRHLRFDGHRFYVRWQDYTGQKVFAKVVKLFVEVLQQVAKRAIP
jgi:hypothetical protein